MSVVDMTCLLCGTTAPGRRGATAELELRCRICGPYTITVGAVNALRNSPDRATHVRAEVERRRADGDPMPRVDMDLLDMVRTA